jgi:hypothetical protein
VQCSGTKGEKAGRAILQLTAIMYTSAVAMALYRLLCHRWCES